MHSQEGALEHRLALRSGGDTVEALEGVRVGTAGTSRRRDAERCALAARARGIGVQKLRVGLKTLPCGE
jgi:hypothetical protein